MDKEKGLYYLGVSSVDDRITPFQRKELLGQLRQRKKEVLETLQDIDNAIGRLEVRCPHSETRTDLYPGVTTCMICDSAV